MTALNSFPINTTTLPLASTTGDYVFDGFLLHDLINITLKKIDNDDLGKMELATYDLAYNNWWVVSSRYYRGREIRMVGSIKASTPELFQAYMDRLKKALSKVWGILKIRDRKVRATLTSMSYNREHFNIDWSPISLVFTTVDPFWNEWAVSYGYLGVTGTRSEEVSYTGTAPTSPLWYMVFGTGSATTQVSISHKWLSLTVPVTFVSGDVLYIDGTNKQVKKNGVDIDFTGVFPEFTDFSNPFTLWFTGTTLVDVTLIHDNLYL